MLGHEVNAPHQLLCWSTWSHTSGTTLGGCGTSGTWDLTGCCRPLKMTFLLPDSPPCDQWPALTTPRESPWWTEFLLSFSQISLFSQKFLLARICQSMEKGGYCRHVEGDALPPVFPAGLSTVQLWSGIPWEGGWRSKHGAGTQWVTTWFKREGKSAVPIMQLNLGDITLNEMRQTQKINKT